jgi:hypothetical protein
METTSVELIGHRSHNDCILDYGLFAGLESEELQAMHNINNTYVDVLVIFFLHLHRSCSAAVYYLQKRVICLAAICLFCHYSMVMNSYYFHIIHKGLL